MGEANTVAMMSAPPDLEGVVRDYLEAADWTRTIPSATHPYCYGRNDRQASITRVTFSSDR
jgi:hypothetical protein